MGGSSMPKADYDLMVIMYSAYGTHHRLCNIDGNKIPANPATNLIMKTESSISPTTPPVLAKMESLRLIHPLPGGGGGGGGGGGSWPGTRRKYTNENTFARCQSSVGYLSK